MPIDPTEPGTEGLRARKRRETRQRIAETGLRMFIANGFDATTLDAIAEAANISRRSFFHYFQSKEAVLEGWESEADEAFRAAMVAQPPDAAPLVVVRDGMLSVISRYQTDQAIAIDRLLRSTEALRARKTASYEHKERVVLAALTERWPDPAKLPSLRVTAMIGVGALRLAAEAWSAEGGTRSLADYVTDTFAVLAGLETAVPREGLNTPSRV
jgi:AcrR family transcriptional regulator